MDIINTALLYGPVTYITYDSLTDIRQRLLRLDGQQMCVQRRKKFHSTVSIHSVWSLLQKGKTTQAVT